MHYSYEATVLNTHTVSSPLVVPMKLGSGIFYKADVVFEVGDGFSTAVVIWDRAKQILPTNPDGFYSGDGVVYPCPCYYNLDKEDNDIFLIAWNRGGVYNHDVNVMLSVRGLDEPDEFGIMKLMTETINRLIQLCRELI